MDAIQRNNPDLALELITMKTTGDKILGQKLDTIGGKGLFVKELETALQEERVDICVHSYKDVPVPENSDLPIVAVLRREDPRDVLIYPAGRDTPDFTKPLGSASLRRQLQLRAVYPDWERAPIRGNIDTRLRKLDSGQFGGLVLAAAALKRLNMWNRVGREFTTEEIVPAACQGVLAIQGRAGENYSFLASINCPDTRDTCHAERAFIRCLDGGCSTPTAAYATVNGGEMVLTGLHVNDLGQVRKNTVTGPRELAEVHGRYLAKSLQFGTIVG